jgi:L-ascorbate metabolism protein UlaG (beta-lactamase superfamily)
MEIRWLGTAGFDIRTHNSRFLIDPYVSRNLTAEPVQPLAPEDLAGADRIFISHGHFDHLMDVPKILAGDTEKSCRVFCSSRAGSTLERLGVAKDRMYRVNQDNIEVRFSHVTARAFFSRHIRFDLRLVSATLARIHFMFFHLLPLFTRYPCGQVLSWQFCLEGRTIQHFGSAGAAPAQLKALAPVDILLLPLQGHTDICKIAAEQVHYLTPNIVIVHHHDNFFPPVSQTIDTKRFVEQVNRETPGTRVILPRINVPITI